MTVAPPRLLVAFLPVLLVVGCVRSTPEERVSNEDFPAGLLAAFTDRVFGNETPHHVWRLAPEGDDAGGRLLFLYLDAEDPEDAEDVWYVGEGVRGRFCIGSQPDGGRTGFVHFHRTTDPSGEWDRDHGGADRGTEGYWLRYTAVADIEMPWGAVRPGIDHDFMPTPAREPCADPSTT